MCAAQGVEGTAHGPADSEHEAGLGRAIVAELVGTFFLTLVATSLEILAEVEPGTIDRVAKAAGQV